MSKVLVILSGGQDSTTCLFWAKKNFSEVHAITFDYGQRHRIEIDSAVRIANMAKVVSHEIVDLPNCLKSASPLTSETELERYENANQMEMIIGTRRELTFVPMRNSLFLVVAANRALEKGCHILVTGVCQMDNANYDDCRRSFISSMQETINLSLGNDHRRDEPWFHIRTPLIDLTKEETVKMAYGMPECWKALAYSHTSYDGKYPPTDMNHANVLRADGFMKAGLPDPLVIRAWHEGLMPLPESANYAANLVQKALFDLELDDGSHL